MGFSGENKLFSEWQETTAPADDDYFLTGKSAIKKIKWSTIINLIKAKLGIADINESISDLNSALGGWKRIDNVVVSGETSITMQNQLDLNGGYLFFFRALDGLDDVHPMYAMLLYLRETTYSKTIIGTPVDVQGYSMSSRRLTVNFTKASWVRMVVYKIM